MSESSKYGYDIVDLLEKLAASLTAESAGAANLIADAIAEIRSLRARIPIDSTADLEHQWREQWAAYMTERAAKSRSHAREYHAQGNERLQTFWEACAATEDETATLLRMFHKPVCQMRDSLASPSPAEGRAGR